MQEGSVGLPHSVQIGHTAPVSYMDFNKRVPSALVSTSFDGTCRLWDTSCTQPAVHVLQVRHQSIKYSQHCAGSVKRQ